MFPRGSVVVSVGVDFAVRIPMCIKNMIAVRLGYYNNIN